MIIAFGLSVIGFLTLGIIYVVKHFIPRKKRELEDFLKIDKDIQKRKELSIESVEFKKVSYDINAKLSQYAKTDKYFLAVSDDKKDVAVDEEMLNHHLHVLGPTGGYLAGFLAASFLVGKMLQKETSNTYKILLSFLAGNAILYTLGVIWLVTLYRISLTDAVRIGVLPFLAVEAVKILAAAYIYRAIADRSRSIFSEKNN